MLLLNRFSARLDSTLVSVAFSFSLGEMLAYKACFLTAQSCVLTTGWGGIWSNTFSLRKPQFPALWKFFYPFQLATADAILVINYFSVHRTDQCSGFLIFLEFVPFLSLSKCSSLSKTILKTSDMVVACHFHGKNGQHIV